MQLRSRFPVRFASLLAGAWIILLAYLEIFGISVGTTFALYQFTEEGKADAQKMLSLQDLDVRQRELGLPENSEARQKVERAAFDIWIKYQRRFYRDFWRVSAFLGIVVAVILARNWMIHRYDTDPFGWRKT